jgi:hypothetical protein
MPLEGMACDQWLEGRGGWRNNARGIAAYHEYLKGIGKDERLQKQEGIVGLSRGWAIGTRGWKAAVAREHSHMAYSRGVTKQEIAPIREAHWQGLLEAELTKAEKSEDELKGRPLCPEWKVAMALSLRTGAGVPVRWITERMNMGKPDALRSTLSRHRTGLLKTKEKQPDFLQ